jgi:hypothetical protein
MSGLIIVHFMEGLTFSIMSSDFFGHDCVMEDVIILLDRPGRVLLSTVVSASEQFIRRIGPILTT